jgi:hypothetical protein
MTIVDYFLIGVTTVVAIYTVYRLFLGWRNSAFALNESADSDERNATHLTSGVRKRATNASNFAS